MANGSYTYDRISRGTLRIDNLTLSILGGIQPGPLSQYLNATLRESYSDDGFMQRFQLLVYPDVSKIWRNVDSEPNRQAASLAYECFAKLDFSQAVLSEGLPRDQIIPRYDVFAKAFAVRFAC